MLVSGEVEVLGHGGIGPHLRLALAWSETVHGSLATCVGAPAVVVPVVRWCTDGIARFLAKTMGR